ncbi:MAG TPA: hypothetical protein PK280_07735 [Planctomycetota bacterium]|nr:hypothetical protein [Planctomycetota bacterium]
MRAGIALLIWLLAAGHARAGESVTMPWEEFKRLYGESVRREVMKELPVREPRAAAAVEEAVYRLTVADRSASLRILLTGRIQAGRPELLRLFPGDAVVGSVGGVKGGSLIAADGWLCLLPAGNSEFQVELELLVPVREDDRSRFVTFPTPPSARNSLSVELPAALRLLSHPGIADRQGALHFASGSGVELRFEERREAPPGGVATAPVPPEIDVLTCVSLQGRKVLLEARLAPARAVGGPVTVRLPEGAGFAGSSLRGSWVEPAAGGAVRIALPAGFSEAFTVACALERPAEDGDFSFALPAVEGNAGREGFLVLEEPEDADVRFSGGEAAAVPAPARLPAGLAEDGKRGMALRAAGGRVTMSVRRFQAVKSPEVVLDSICFLTAFEEGGGALSVLRMRLPAEAGSRLTVRRIPGAEVWSLKVNGERREVYGLDQDTWIVPLARGRDSEVELAFLRRGARLGLQGRLETEVPATGLSARKLLFGAALPPRVDLTSVEGDLSPEQGEAWAAPPEFAGRRYHFSRSFYRGEALKVALAYKEPVEPAGMEKGREP